MSWIITGEQVNPAGDAQITYGITSTGGVFNLRSFGTVDYEVEWGDGTVERSTSNTLAHTYAAGSYVLKIRTSQQYRPFFNTSTDEDQITSVALVSDLDVGTILSNAWRGANNITDFDAAFGVTTGVTNFINTWRDCTSLTSFPLIDVSSGIIFQGAWYNCNQITTFPANFFDSWTGTPVNNCFVDAWDLCSSLTATSVENILNSIDTSLRSAPASGVDITIDYNAASGPLNISTAVNNLKSRNWTITLNGALQ